VRAAVRREAVACLAFSPVTADHCEMDVERFERTPGARANRNPALGRQLPIPVAVLEALDSTKGAPTVEDREPGSEVEAHLPACCSRGLSAGRTIVRAGA
jgi:hypothetical protein